MLWSIFDYLGTIAFAISGTLIGMRQRFDIFGITVLALATAIGGGLIRDTLIGNVPPVSLQHPIYVILTIGTVMTLFLLSGKIRRGTRRHKWSIRLYYLTDTIGLASFTVTGATVGVNSDPQSNFLLPMALGLITACGGGIIRDICAMKVPSVFRTEIYASASLFGAFIFCFVRMHIHTSWALPIAFFVVFGLRTLSLVYNWNLPRSKYR